MGKRNRECTYNGGGGGGGEYTCTTSRPLPLEFPYKNSPLKLFVLILNYVMVFEGFFANYFLYKCIA